MKMGKFLDFKYFNNLLSEEKQLLIRFVLIYMCYWYTLFAQAWDLHVQISECFFEAFYRSNDPGTVWSVSALFV